MTGIWQLAWRYVRFHWGKTCILIACVFLTAILPIAIRILLTQFEQSLVRRADATPAIIGRKGSPLDLVLHSLYFDRTLDETIPFSSVDEVRETQLTEAVPVFANATAATHSVVGTTLDYFRLRGLLVRDGRSLATLGECVIGASVAQKLGLAPGDSLLSDRENMLDIAGKYPLKMKVVGVLAAGGSADDQAVFVDLKTAWVIEGLGHGHQELQNETDDAKVLRRSDDQLVASAAVLPFTEITPHNIGSFHFHGDIDDFPVTAILAFTTEQKSNTLLEGRFDTADGDLQFIRPSSVIRDLMAVMFRVKRFFDINAVLIAASTALLMLLVMLLSARLRRAEMETLFKLGCARGTVVGLQVAELMIVFVIAAGLVGIASWCVWFNADRLVQAWVEVQ